MGKLIPLLLILEGLQMILVELMLGLVDYQWGS